jgi:hypothetical protein
MSFYATANSNVYPNNLSVIDSLTVVMTVMKIIVVSCLPFCHLWNPFCFSLTCIRFPGDNIYSTNTVFVLKITLVWGFFSVVAVYH